MLENYKRKPTKEEINALPIRCYEGPVKIVRNEEELEQAVAMLEGERVLGFDTETRPTFRKGRTNSTALVQMASSRAVYIFQLHFVPFGPRLASILADSRVLKVGVSINEDMRDLQKLYDFTPAGVVDLGKTAHALKMETHGLRNLAANLLGFRITKGSQCSNWNLPVLTQKQVSYAATDAWIGREVYLKMRELGFLHENFIGICS